MLHSLNLHTPIFNELTSELLGRYLSSHAFNRVTSQSLEPSDRERDLRPSIRDSEYAGVEQAAMHLRQSASRKHGAIALGVLLETIRDRLDRQLRLMKMNTGGNPGNVYRRYAILELAGAYREATGKHPTATATGFIYQPLLCSISYLEYHLPRTRQGCREYVVEAPIPQNPPVLRIRLWA